MKFGDDARIWEHMIRRTALFFLLFAFVQLAFGQNTFITKDLSHYYNLQSELRVFHRVVNVEGNTLLFLKLTINDDRAKIEDLVTQYAFLDGYAEELTLSQDTVQLKDFWQYTELNNHYFRFEIKNENADKLLVIRIDNRATGNAFYFDLPADPLAPIVNSGIVLKWPDQNIPFYRHYIQKNEAAAFISLSSPDSTLYGYHYSSDFKIADPPFSTSNTNVVQSINIDSAFTIQLLRPYTFNKTGLYFVQVDSSSSNGMAFRVESNPYPRQGTYEELIESLTYFTTRSEINKLMKATDKKKAFDAYWIEIAKSSDRARKIIKEYYSRVSLANHLFSTYKQGWKTDKGMIYIIYGPPDNVFRDGEREEWIYERTTQLPRINFTFINAKSIFTNDHFVLLRKSGYEQVWYKAIDLWRKGLMRI